MDAILDGFAELVASKLNDRLSSDSGSAGARKGAVRPRLLDVDQAALYIGRSKHSVYRMISDGLLPTVRADRRVFLDVRDLDTWIEANKCRN